MRVIRLFGRYKVLRSWLDLKSTSSSYPNPNGYGFVAVAEQSPLDLESARRAIREWIRHCYCPSDYVLQRLTEGAFDSPEQLYQQEKFPQHWNNKAADLGEAIGHFLLESHPNFGFWLPVLRLREKPDPEGSMRGFDLLGFQLEEQSGANVLCIGEVRLRTTRKRSAMVDGHATLASYNRKREIIQIGRIAQWLFEQSRADEGNKLARFGDSWAQEPFERQHTFIGIFDESLRIDDMINKMNEVTNILSTFVACIVAVVNLHQRIQEAYEP